jgi:hypothetical protein
MVDEDRLFISGPAVVETLHDNRPVFRRFESPFRRGAILFPQAQMTEDALYYVELNRFLGMAAGVEPPSLA